MEIWENRSMMSATLHGYQRSVKSADAINRVEPSVTETTEH